jgi:YD repeat-containing protein
MHNHNSSTQVLGIFGWNFSFIGDIKITTDSDGSVTIYGSEIGSLFPQQLSGTALYTTNTAESPLETLFSNPYTLNSQQLLNSYSDNKRMFLKQTDGSYQGENGTLTWNIDHYELKETDGSLIVFRPDGQLNYAQDSNGYKITAGYTNNLLTSLSNSNGESFNLVYNAQGRVNTVTDERGQTTTYTYDTTGQYLLSVKDINGKTSFSYGNPYDPTLVTGVTYADGRKVNYDYDQYGRLQQVIVGEGREALAYTYNYDASGNLTIIDPTGATTQEIHNQQGQISQTIDPLGNTTSYSYDSAGNLTSISSALGFNSSFNYDAQGNLTSQTDALGNTTSFAYETNSDKLASFTDAKGNSVSYDYDAKGNLTDIIYADNSHQHYDYNANGLLVQSANRRGQSIAYEYNNNHQITKETHSDGSIITYEYVTVNDLLSSTNINNRGNITQIEYNQAQNKLSFSNPNGLIHIYDFDELGRKTQIIIQDANNTYTTNYSYDSLGRLDKLTDSTGKLIVDYDHNFLTGLLQKETNGNGTYTTYAYDVAGQIASIINYGVNNAINSRSDYTYDQLGRRTSLNTLDGTWNYTYDLTGQLTRAIFNSVNASIASQETITITSFKMLKVILPVKPMPLVIQLHLHMKLTLTNLPALPMLKVTVLVMTMMLKEI